MSLIAKFIAGKLRIRQLFKSDIEDFAHTHTIDDLPTHILNKQPDWNQANNTEDDFIKNKPTIPAAQIQSDWNQTDNTAKDFIKNKPTVLGKVWKYKIADNWWFSGSTSVLPFDGDAINSIRDFSNTTYLDVPGAAGIFKIPTTGYYTINSALLIMPGYQDTFETQMMSLFYLKVMKNASEAGKLNIYRVAYKDAAGTGANYYDTDPYLAGKDTYYFEADDLVSVNIEAVGGTFNNQILFKYARLVIKKELL